MEARARVSGDLSWAHVGVRLDSVVGAIGLGFGIERQFTDADEELFREFAYICLAATERARLYEHQASARKRAETIADQSAGLVAAALAVNSASNPREVLESLIKSAEMTVRGSVGLAAYWRDDEAEPAVALASPDRAPPSDNHVRWVRRQLRRGTSTVIIADHRLGTAPEDWRGCSAVALVPIVAAGSRLGALTLLLDKPEVTPEDSSLFAALASICSQAFERARLQEREHEMAKALQQSLLSLELPRVPGTSIAARYLPSYDELEIGGDWFQVLPVTETQVALVVGDVVGRGLPAASAMGQLRSALTGAAINRPSPVQVLRSLDVAAGFIPGALYTTVAYCLLDPWTGLLRYACAGHPPPLLIEREGNSRFLRQGRGAPLGVETSVRDREGRETLSPGDQVILYTDGLVERRNEGIDDGLERLMLAATQAYGLGVDTAADRLLGSMLDPAQSAPDDVTLLWLELHGGRDEIVGLVEHQGK
ncbi:MAG: PP2C family protein-serine/threonine phosphatase [Acidimicrobiia bacterium]